MSGNSDPQTMVDAIAKIGSDLRFAFVKSYTAYVTGAVPHLTTKQLREIERETFLLQMTVTTEMGKICPVCDLRTLHADGNCAERTNISDRTPT